MIKDTTLLIFSVLLPTIRIYMTSNQLTSNLVTFNQFIQPI